MLWNRGVEGRERLDEEGLEGTWNKIEGGWNPSLGMGPWASSSASVFSSVKWEEESLQRPLRKVSWMKHVNTVWAIVTS